MVNRALVKSIISLGSKTTWAGIVAAVGYEVGKRLLTDPDFMLWVAARFGDVYDVFAMEDYDFPGLVQAAREHAEKDVYMDGYEAPVNSGSISTAIGDFLNPSPESGFSKLYLWALSKSNQPPRRSKGQSIVLLDPSLESDFMDFARAGGGDTSRPQRIVFPGGHQVIASSWQGERGESPTFSASFPQMFVDQLSVIEEPTAPTPQTPLAKEKDSGSTVLMVTAAVAAPLVTVAMAITVAAVIYIARSRRK